MANPTNTIRLPSRTYARLRGLARASGKPMSIVIDEAIDRYEAERFFRDLDAAYRDLRADDAAWQAEQAERARLERTLADGLGDE